MSSYNRVQSYGVVVDYMSRCDRDNLDFDVCIDFELSRVKTVSLPSKVLIDAGVSIEIDRIIVAEIDPEADDEFWLQPSSIRPLNINMEEVYTWR